MNSKLKTTSLPIAAAALLEASVASAAAPANMNTSTSFGAKSPLLFLLVLGSLLVTTPASAACVNFLGFADNAMLGNAFNLNNFAFKSPPAHVPFVNVFSDVDGNPVHGVQFSTSGLRVRLPNPSQQADIEIGVFHSPNVTIRGIDAGGAIVASANVAADNDMHFVTLYSGNPMVRLVFTGGGNEGVINEICNF